jgi:hypothetical protein
MDEEAAPRPTETRRRRLIGALAYPAAVIFGYLSYWVVAGVPLDGLLRLAALRGGNPPYTYTVSEVLFVVSGFLAGLVAGIATALFWPTRRAALVALLLGSALGWEEMSRPAGYLLVLRTLPVVARLPAFLAGAVISYGLVGRRLARRRRVV